jgi:ribosome-associated heat shock protein Hsp15
MDKWLWAARFFKTRSLSADACDLGRIESNGITAKPAREVRVGDMLQIRCGSGQFTVEVLGQTLYRETEESRELRRKAAEERKAMPLFESVLGDSRPSKRNRRELDKLRGRS